MSGEEAAVPIDVPPLTVEDIEAAYERALQAMESVEAGLEYLDTAATALGTSVPVDDVATPTPSMPAHLPLGAASEPGAADERPTPSLHPREIIEAALFVGGKPLTAKRLSQTLGTHETPERIDEYIEQLNAAYRDECRPYEIDFGEGGYRLVLRPEFEPVRRSVFGAGPKDVRLSQEVLEALAFVAYRQPTTKEALEEAGKEGAGGLLRQLVRRELVSLGRNDLGEVIYRTTPRFLELFGLRSLDDLPFPEDLVVK